MFHKNYFEQYETKATLILSSCLELDSHSLNDKGIVLGWFSYVQEGSTCQFYFLVAILFQVHVKGRKVCVYFVNLKLIVDPVNLSNFEVLSGLIRGGSDIIVGVFYCIWPKVIVCGFWSSHFCMDYRFTRLILNILYSLFRNSILQLNINVTVGDVQTLVDGILLKHIVCKSCVIAVVMMNLYSMFTYIALKFFLE